MSPKDITRFEEKFIVVGECHLWTDKPDKKGYGRFYINGCNKLAHCISYIKYYNKEPDGYLTQSCGNKLCVNPAHLKIKGAT